jgi:hypothetical protein
MKKKCIKYMHTIDGEPGTYFKGEQIGYAGHSQITLCDSLKQLHQEEKASAAWRRSKGWFVHSYGWAKVIV